MDFVPAGSRLRFENRFLKVRRTGHVVGEPPATLRGVSRQTGTLQSFSGRDGSLQSVRAMKTSNGVGRAPGGARPRASGVRCWGGRQTVNKQPGRGPRVFTKRLQRGS